MSLLQSLLHRINVGALSEYLQKFLSWAAEPEHAGYLLLAAGVLIAGTQRGRKGLAALLRRFRPQYYEAAKQMVEVAATTFRGIHKSLSSGDPDYEIVDAVASALEGQNDPVEGWQRLGRLLAWLVPGLPIALGARRRSRVKQVIMQAVEKVFGKWSRKPTEAQARLTRLIVETFTGPIDDYVDEDSSAAQVYRAAVKRYKAASPRVSDRQFLALAGVLTNRVSFLTERVDDERSQKLRRREEILDLLDRPDVIEAVDCLLNLDLSKLVAAYGRTSKPGSTSLVNASGAPLGGKVRSAAYDPEPDRERKLVTNGSSA